MRVFVKNLKEQNLMPCSQRKARLLLKQNKAKIHKYNPFTIQLLIPTGETVQACNLGIDSGARYVGFAITSQDKVFVKGEIELRNDIKQLLFLRKTYRRTRRSHKTRYRQARWLNRSRKRLYGWLPPSIQSRIDNQIFWISKFKELLPNCNLIIEVGKFDVKRLENIHIENDEYQPDDLYGYENVKAYLIEREKNKCQLCGKTYDGLGWHIHHIKQRKYGGSNRVENLALVHKQCHKDFHFGLIKKKFKKPKEYKETTFMNILRSQIMKRVDCEVTYGGVTKINRQFLKLEKTHYNDAITISEIKYIKEDCNDILCIKQSRKKKRSLHESTARKGRKEPNREAKRNSKNTKYSHGYYLNDKVKVFDKVGWISGFAGYCCYIKDNEDNYIINPDRVGKGVSLKELTLINHNNNWRFSYIYK